MGLVEIQGYQEADVNVIAASVPVDSGIPVPTTAWFFVNFGAANDGTSLENGNWLRVNRAMLLTRNPVPATPVALSDINDGLLFPGAVSYN